jgi:hypothetical protein
MNKYLHYYTPFVLGTLFGFILGYGFRCKELKTLKNLNQNLTNENLELSETLEKICQVEKIE